MNPPPDGAFEEDSPFRTQGTVDVYVFPTFLDLAKADDAGLIVGAQFGHPEACGTHTGDVSMKMLKDLQCHEVLCGHSERRANHGETNEDVAAQAIAALEVGLHPIVCIGETEEEREKGKEKKVIEEQLKPVPTESDIIIAYEPVWAIGTGKTATPEQAQEMHAFIRSQLPEDRREETRILYGGSVKPDNAEDLLKQPDIDGALVGGASLKPEDFKQIVEAALVLSSDEGVAQVAAEEA